MWRIRSGHSREFYRLNADLFDGCRDSRTVGRGLAHPWIELLVRREAVQHVGGNDVASTASHEILLVWRDETNALCPARWTAIWNSGVERSLYASSIMM